MENNELKWLDCEYLGNPEETVQTALVNGRPYYVVFDRAGRHYLYATIYELMRGYLGSDDDCHIFYCESEAEMEEYLKTAKL